MSARVLTLGETMALLTTPASGRLTLGGSLTVGLGGAESNTAIGLARLGVPTAWVSRVGDDAYGRLITRELRAEGVEVLVDVDAVAPTGSMLKELHAGRPRRVRYQRAGSAASRLTPAHVDAVSARITAADVVHLSGITPALGPGPAAVVERAVELARSAGTEVSFDVNHRTALWSAQEAGPVLAGTAARADVLFAGPEEAAMLLTGAGAGTENHPVPTDPDAAAACARRLCELGAGTVVVKLGALGSVAAQGGRVWVAPTHPVDAVDTVGAGDAFVAGFLAARLAGQDVPRSLAQGNAAGGAVCQVPGDWEGAPTRDELADLLERGRSNVGGPRTTRPSMEVQR